MKKTILFSLVFLLVATTLITSCRKKDKEEEEPTIDTQTTKDNDKVQNEWDDLLSITENAMDENDSNTDKTSFTLCGDTNKWCAVVCIDTAYTNATNGAIGRIIIDFDSVSATSCTSQDAKVRTGKIFIEYTGKYRTTGTKIYTTLSNYYVNGIKVEGNKVVENLGNNSFKVDVSNAKITFLDQTTITWQSSRTRTWTAGQSTLLNIFDDEYVIDGTASGTNRVGRNFTATINDVKVKLSCWLSAIFVPVSGTINIQPDGFSERVLDYGSGTCDKNATVTVNGKVYDITL